MPQALADPWGRGGAHPSSSSKGLKKRQNAPFSFTAFKISLQVKTFYQIVTECTIDPPYRFKKHPNTPIPLLIFKKIQDLRAQPTSRPLNEVKACAVPSHGSFKYRFRMCHNNACESVLASKSFVQFQIVSNAVRMHHLASQLFYLFCSFQLFQIPSECTLHCPCFRNFLCSSKSFQIVQEYMLYLVIDLSLKFQISISNSVRMFHFTVNVFKNYLEKKTLLKKPIWDIHTQTKYQPVFRSFYLNICIHDQYVDISLSFDINSI